MIDPNFDTDDPDYDGDEADESVTADQVHAACDEHAAALRALAGQGDG